MVGRFCDGSHGSEVIQGSFCSSYRYHMRCFVVKEKRHYERVSLVGYDYDCSIHLDGMQCYARLHDISQGGARFVLHNDFSAASIDSPCRGEVIDEYCIAPYIKRKGYIVVWRVSNEIGVLFSYPLFGDYEVLRRHYDPLSLC